MILVLKPSPTFRVARYEKESNELVFRTELDFFEEKMIHAELKSAIYKQKSARYYNSKVRHRRF